MKPTHLLAGLLLGVSIACSPQTLPTVSVPAENSTNPPAATVTRAAPTAVPATPVPPTPILPTIAPTMVAATATVVSADNTLAEPQVVMTLLGDAVHFKGPTGIVLDPQGNAYVVDAGNSRIVKFDASGKPLFAFGTKGSEEGQFFFASENVGYIARDSTGNLYIADPDNQRISKFDADGKFLAQWNFGTKDEPLYPGFLAMDGKDNLFVIVYQGDKPLIQKYSTEGKQLVQWDLEASKIKLSSPLAITADKEGRVYIPDLIGIVYTFDGDGNLLDKFSLPPVNKLFTTPTGIVRVSDGSFYISDGPNDRVVRVDAEGKLLQAFGKNGSGPGEFFRPYGVAVDDQGRVYVVENVNDRVQVFGD